LKVSKLTLKAYEAYMLIQEDIKGPFTIFPEPFYVSTYPSIQHINLTDKKSSGIAINMRA
jgi:hypothetical protein